MRPHAANNRARPCQQIGDDLYGVGLRNGLEQHQVAASDGKAGHEGGLVVAVIYIERLKTKREYQDEGAGKDGERDHAAPMYGWHISSQLDASGISCHDPRLRLILGKSSLR